MEHKFLVYNYIIKDQENPFLITIKVFDYLIPF